MRLSESRVVVYGVAFIGILSLTWAQQDPFGDVLNHNSQIWKSFQEEMKTLEEAAHKVNSLLVRAAHPRVPGDQDANPAETTSDVAVPSSEEKSDDTDIATSAPNKPDTDVDNDDIDEVDALLGQPLHPRPFNIGSLFGIFNNLPEPWWKGKNVCVERSEKVDNKSNGESRLDKQVLIMGIGTFEHCKQTSGKYICTTVTSGPDSSKSVSTTYQCCEGFRRQVDGCEKVDLKDVVEVCDSLGSKDFAAMLKSQDVMRSFTEHNVTVFAPTDDAMRKRSDLQNKLSKNKKRTTRAVEEYNDIASAVEGSPQSTVSTQDLVLAHITESLLDVDDFNNEMVVKSSYKDSPLRINIYPGREDGVMTVNCARVTSWDHLATSARVHTIDRVLEPVTQSVVDILSQPQFSQFKQYLEQEGLMEKLANQSAVTVFAPNNEAWDKLGNGLKDKYSRGDACIDKVLRHHILPLTLCSAPALEGRLTTADLDGELVRLGWDSEGQQLMVNDKGRVVQSDIVATNGVVHELDKVLTPKSAKPLSELLLTSNHTAWLELLDKAGLLEDLNKQENITMFVPPEHLLTNELVKRQLDEMDADALRQVLLYHITQRVPACELRNKAELKTQNGATLRVTMFNPHSMFAGMEPRAAVQCVPLGYTDGKACHVVAHEVTRLLLPPNATVLQTLANDPQLSFIRRVIEGTQVEKDIEEKSELFADGFTLLAPTDQAFNKLDEEMLTKLLSDKKFADQVVRMHLLKETVCCASVTSVPWPFTTSVRTLDNTKLEVNRDRKNQVLFGNSVTESCDVMATDGIVHIVDSVILPESSKVKLGNIAFGSPSGKIMLFGI